MQDLPHYYRVSASADSQSRVLITSEGLPGIETAGPPEFGGPGDVWSPETLLVGSVANCFVLTFRAIARASEFEWQSLRCAVSGTLEKVDRVTQFTDFNIEVELAVPAGSNEKKAHRLLEKAEHGCLITNSLTAAIHLGAKVNVGN